MRITWQPKAVKQLKKLKDKQLIRRIGDAVTSLEHFPNVRNIKRLVSHQHSYRLRVGQYRILFNVDQVIEVVLIEEVKKRDERTY